MWDVRSGPDSRVPLPGRRRAARAFRTYDGDRPLRAADVTDPYRTSMFTIARATSRAERAWLREVLGSDDDPAAPSGTDG